MLRDLIVVRRVYLHVQSVHHSAELEKRVEPSSQYSDSEGSVEERTHSTFRSSLSKRLRTQLQQKSMLALSPQLPAQPTSEAVDTVAKQTSPKPGMFQPVSLPACAVNMAAASSTVQGIGSYPLTCMRDSCRHRTSAGVAAALCQAVGRATEQELPQVQATRKRSARKRAAPTVSDADPSLTSPNRRNAARPTSAESRSYASHLSEFATRLKQHKNQIEASQSAQHGSAPAGNVADAQPSTSSRTPVKDVQVAHCLS